jgi:FeS assembly SUF system protein
MISNTEIEELGEEIVKVICTIYDPEIPVNIYELGLIYDVEVSDIGDVRIEMTLTSPNCPVAESLPAEVEEKVKAIDKINDAKVNIVFGPPWTKEMMRDEAKLELGML